MCRPQAAWCYGESLVVVVVVCLTSRYTNACKKKKKTEIIPFYGKTDS